MSHDSVDVLRDISVLAETARLYAQDSLYESALEKLAEITELLYEAKRKLRQEIEYRNATLKKKTR